MALSAAEQYLLELINRARLDPQSEAARYGVALNAGLNAGTITGAALQVLAPNVILEQSALGHSQWMLSTDTFDHTGINASDPGDRMSAAGYQFTGDWAWAENLAWSGTTGTIDMQAAIAGHHAGLYRSAGHRKNTFDADVREIGIAQVNGSFTKDGKVFDSSMLTLNFAVTGHDAFLTGVAYRDADEDGFYDIGEGQAALDVRAGGQSAVTASAGGYALGVTPGKDTTVTLSQNGITLATLQVDLSGGNGKLDVVTDADGHQSLALSASATLVSGLSTARLLGIADLDLTGSDAANILIGNAGENRLWGAGGDDHLSGGAGADMLYGGAGNDLLEGGTGRDAAWEGFGLRSKTGSENADNLSGGAGDDHLIGLSGFDVLDGGAGDDILTGGGGRDTFIFNGGQDRVTDFADNVDTLHLDRAALGLAADVTIAQVLAMADIQNGDALFDFGDHGMLTLTGVTDLDMLGNDLLII